MSTLKAVQTPTIGPQLYQLLPRRYRANDHSPLLCTGETQRLKFTQRFFRVFGDTYDSIRNRYGELLNWHNPYRAPADVLEYLAANYGWPLDTSIDEDFQRILINNLHLIYSLAGTERGIRIVLYAHLGISPRIIRSNGPDTARAVLSMVLAADSTNEYLDVTSGAGTLLPGDIITVTDGWHTCETTVVQMVSNRIYISGLSHTIRKGGRVIKGRFNPHGKATVGGSYLFRSDSTLSDLNGRTGDSSMRSISDADRALRMTLIFQWPHTFTAAQLNLATYLVEYMIPARDHYAFKYESFTACRAVSDLSRTDTRARTAS